MPRMINRFSLLIALIFVLGSSYGQETSYEDRIRLRSGKVVTGVITEFKPGDYVVIRKQENGRLSRYPVESIAAIVQTGKEEVEGVYTPYLIKLAVNSTLELRDGTTYQGQVISYRPGGNIRIELDNGTALSFLEGEVLRIAYDLPKGFGKTEMGEEEVVRRIGELEESAIPRPKPPYEFRERGVFNATSFSFSFGAREQNNDSGDIFFPTTSSTRSTIGFNVQHILGYQFKRMLGVGIGASYDAYDLEDGESILSLFAHYRGYLMQKNVSPYIGVSGGYGFALRNENQGITHTEGGWMLHPEIGLRLGAASKANFTFSLGYRMQAAYYVQEFPFNGNIEYRNLVYRRMLFSLGLVF